MCDPERSGFKLWFPEFHVVLLPTGREGIVHKLTHTHTHTDTHTYAQAHTHTHTHTHAHKHTHFPHVYLKSTLIHTMTLFHLIEPLDS